MTKHYGDSDGLKVLSYNAIITEVVSNRNYGKTWAFKRRAVRRAFKHGKKTIWLRLFKKEADECADTFFSSSDLQKYCGISIYDKDHNKDGNIKQIGKTFYYRKLVRGKWTRWKWFLKVYKLSDAGALRSADDVNIDTIVFDEFTKPKSDLTHYHGDIAAQLSDILITLKREHEVRYIVIGNKESVTNPINDYFKVTPPPFSYEGIKRYRKGAFVLQQINNKPQNETDYDNKLFNLFDGTPYGNYMYKDTYRTAKGFKRAKTPPNAGLYCQLYIKGHALKISTENDLFYVSGKVDNTRRIFCDVLPHKYVHEQQLVKRYRKYFNALIDAIADNRIYYDNALANECFQDFYKWLSI